MVKSNYRSGYTMHFDATENIRANANKLRKQMTHAEKLLWNKLKNNQVLGFKFRRQHPIDIFIADFYCHKAKLIIEVDGEIHNSKHNKESDKGRTIELEELGLTVIRFTNKEVEDNINDVILRIKRYLS